MMYINIVTVKLERIAIRKQIKNKQNKLNDVFTGNIVLPLKFVGNELYYNANKTE